ncbi:MAG: hypothetical protein JNL38_27300 [Myxococcales bacterium]|jgi:hypothetical protein|nr:hypothetical protein [Myxococcales bacterium]
MQPLQRAVTFTLIVLLAFGSTGCRKLIRKLAGKGDYGSSGYSSSGSYGSSGYGSSGSSGYGSSGYGSSGYGSSSSSGYGSYEGSSSSSGSSAASTLGWRTYAPDRKFSLNMPGAPKESVQQIPSAMGNIAQKQAMATRSSSAVYMIAYMDIPPDVPFDSKAGLDGARDAAIKSASGQLVSEKNIKLDGKHPGRALTVSITSPIRATLQARLYMVGKRFYQLQVIVPTSAVSIEGTSPDTFFDSFKLTP